MEFAQMMCKSNFVPAHLRGKPADCLAVTLQALRWNMDPFAVAQKTYFVKEGATPAYEAQLVTAVIYARAPLEGRLNLTWEGSGNDLVVTVTGKFKGDPVPKVRRVENRTITTRNSPLWKSDPQQQLAYYAIRAWARLYAPDVIMGVYTGEEIEAGQHVGADNAKDVTPEKPTTKLDALEDAIEQAAPTIPAEAVDLPSDWNLWHQDVASQISAAQDGDDLDLLLERHAEALNAAPEVIRGSIARRVAAQRKTFVTA
jgi:hypothetical protein